MSMLGAAITSAFLLAIAYPRAPGYLAWIIFIGLVPLLREIYRRRGRPSKGSFLVSWLGGTLFMSLVTSWALAAHPLTWLGVSAGALSLTITIIFWLAASAVLGLGMASFVISARRLASGGLRDLVLLPSLWILQEYGRSIALSIFFFGNNARIGNVWTFGSLGYAAVELGPLASVAKFVGLYGIGFLIVFVNVLVARSLPHTFEPRFDRTRVVAIARSLLPAAGVVGIFFMAATLTNAFYPTNITKRQTVALVQVNFPSRFQTPPDEERARVETTLALITRIREQPDLIVLPEGSNLGRYFGGGLRETLDLVLAENQNPLIIDVSSSPRGENRRETIFYVSRTDGLVAFRPKELFIPGGEYLPGWIAGIARTAGARNWVDEFRRSRALQPADPPPSELDADETAIGTVACSGITTPTFYRRLAGNKAEILVNAASQVIFKKSRHFLDQVEVMIRFHAQANHRPVVQAANGGFSYHINPNGTVAARTETLGNQLLLTDVPFVANKTLYSRVGEWTLAFAAGTLLFEFLRRRGTLSSLFSSSTKRFRSGLSTENPHKNTALLKLS